MTEPGRRAKRVIGSIYSAAADTVYNKLVVNGAFKLFGGRLNDLVLEQGRKAVETAAGRPILDVPVGTAYFTIEAARRHEGLVVGVDIAQGMVLEARRAAERAGVRNLSVVRADAHHLPFPDGTFGAILCTNGIQVMPGLMETFRELARVLAPTGLLYLSTITLPLGRALPRETARRLPTVLMSAREIRSALAEAGFPGSYTMRSRLGYVIGAEKSNGVRRSAAP